MHKLAILLALILALPVLAEELEESIIKDFNSLLNPGSGSTQEAGSAPAAGSDAIRNEPVSEFIQPGTPKKSDSKKSGTKASENFTQLSLSKNTLRKVLESLSELAGYNLFLDEAVPDKSVQLIVKDLVPKEALKNICISNGLKYKFVDRKNLFIFPAQKDANYMGDEVQRTFILQYSDATQVSAIVKSVDRTVKAFVSEKSNYMVVFAPEDKMVQIDKLIKELDQKKPQVMLDMKLLEVSSATVDKLGLSVSDPLAQVSLADFKPVGTTGKEHLTIISPNLVYESVKSDTTTKTLARPKIILMPKETAKIRLGLHTPVEIISSETAEGVNRQNNRIDWVDSGIKLEAELLQFNASNEVTISVKTEVSTPTSTTTKSGAPELKTREADTKLRLKNGETVILGGLINQFDENTRQTKPPLSRIPIIGRLFRDHSGNITKTEIMIFITPYFMN
ncbi:MAG: hypothetical protein PHW04_09525 [Candidatus Wallbacteria bacterium]|nr:hypothetical protein [Candidatus Wallbacteria bacterium]